LFALFIPSLFDYKRSSATEISLPERTAATPTIALILRRDFPFGMVKSSKKESHEKGMFFVSKIP